MSYLCENMEKMIQFTKGCTEPAAIALNASYVGQNLKNAKKITLDIDKMTYKNAYRAGIPNSKDNIGVEFSTLFGYLIADPSNQLEIFDKLNDGIIKKAKAIYKNVQVNIIDTNDMFIKTTAYGEDNEKAYAITEHFHTNIKKLIVNEKTVIDKKQEKENDIYFDKEFYNTEKWNEYIEEMYKDKRLREKTEKALNINMEALEKSLDYDEDSIFSSVYARMKGDKITVASCAGSGNKGLTALIAPVEYAKSIDADKETTIKAALLSCFVTSLITSRLGFISSVCGVVHAAGVGVLAAILYLDNNLDIFEDAFKNYIVAKGGVICDGAKKSCAVKASNAVESAYLSIEFASRGVVMDYKDGLLGKTFYDTVQNLELYKEAFGMLDIATIKILQSKNLK